MVRARATPVRLDHGRTFGIAGAASFETTGQGRSPQDEDSLLVNS
jgi:hypothetical protein